MRPPVRRVLGKKNKTWICHSSQEVNSFLIAVRGGRSDGRLAYKAVYALGPLVPKLDGGRSRHSLGLDRLYTVVKMVTAKG
jgi:hypothetical protein